MGAKTIKARLLVSVTAATALLVLAGCGGTGANSKASGNSTGSTDASATQAKALLAKTSGKLQWFNPGPGFQAKKSLKGEKLLFITVQLNTPFSQNILTGLKQGAALVDATVNAADSGGNPAEAARQVTQGVSQHVAGIVIQGIPSAAISAQLKTAKAAGIPVVMLFDAPNTGTPSASQKADGVVGNVDMCWACEGQAMAQAAVAQQGDKVNSVFIYASELISAAKQEQAYVAELKKLCPTCQSKVTNVPVAQWSTGLQGAAANAVANPKVNIVAPVYDLMVPPAQAAIAAAQAGSRVDLITGDATITGIAALAKDPTVKYVAGAPAEWAGWLAIDQWLRAENGQGPASNTTIPIRGFTAQMLKDENFDVSSKANETRWFTDIDFNSEFRKLWGL